MRRRYYLFWFISFLVFLSLTGCSMASAFNPSETPTATIQPTSTATITPTATKVPYYLDATVWDGSLQIPILIYHEFVPDYMNTDATKMRLSDFKDELQQFYDAGFSLISLKDWINGVVDVPAGRKPMVLTIDDLWFGNQIYISEDGNPSIYSGIGVLWRFSQEHPDFGFHAALFAINGDKLYPEKEVTEEYWLGDRFWAADGVDFYSKSWHIKLGNTIAWAIEHDLEVYNHTFMHPWNWTSYNDVDIEAQLADNDNWLRQFLTEAGRTDLIPKLDNIVALPQGLWPDTYTGKQVIMDYVNPEGKPVMAIMEAYNMNAVQLTPSIFSDEFNPYHIARITASVYMMNYIISHKDEVPTMALCKLGPLDESQVTDQTIIQTAIQTAVSTQACPEGIYNVNGSVFVAKSDSVTLHGSNGTTLDSIPPTTTPTIAP